MAQRKGEERSCEQCGKSIGVVPPSRLAKGEGRFCGLSCAVASRPRVPRTYPAGEERACERCGKSRYVPGWLIARGGGRFCTRSCAASDRVTLNHAPIRALRADRERCATEIVRLKAEQGLVGIAELAERTGLSLPAIYSRYSRGQLPKASRAVDGHTLLVPEPAAKAFVTALARSDSPYRKCWLEVEPEVARLISRGHLARLRDNGLTDAEARAVLRVQAEERVKRRRRVLPHRSGRPIADATREWAASLLEIERELHENHAIRDTLGLAPERPPSRYAAACELVYRDAQAHPERWPANHYPRTPDGEITADATRLGAGRILRAVKRLQISASIMI